MIFRPDLIHPQAPAGIEVFQLTDENIPSSHVYMEAQVFSPDSKWFILHRQAAAHQVDYESPEHKYLLCDLENNGELTPLTNDLNAKGPSLSPDGKYLYYIIDNTVIGGGRLIVKRVEIKSGKDEIVTVLDKPAGEAANQVSRLYSLSTISSDGNRLLTSGFLGDGRTNAAPFGVIVFDLTTGEANCILQGPDWINTHPQYCRSTDSEACHDVMIQHNHGGYADAQGKSVKGHRGGILSDIDIHVLRDDGTNMRSLPWARNGSEFCQGHQCWRGMSTTSITSTSAKVPSGRQLVEGRAEQDANHLGSNLPNAYRNEVSRSYPGLGYGHFSTDVTGRLLVSDGIILRSKDDYDVNVYVARLSEKDHEPAEKLLHLVLSKTRHIHIHPFISPDGTKAFFNSDESGVCQAYMISGFDTSTG